MSEGIPRVRVFNSNGTLGGGLWRPHVTIDDRFWTAPPSADYVESLYVSEDGFIIRYFKSKNPRITGSRECGDLFDSDSYAIHSTSSEAADWLVRYGYVVPHDLARAKSAGKELSAFIDLWTGLIRKRAGESEFDQLSRREAMREIGELLNSAVQLGAFQSNKFKPAKRDAGSIIPGPNPQITINAWLELTAVSKQITDSTTNFVIAANLAKALDEMDPDQGVSRANTPLKSSEILKQIPELNIGNGAWVTNKVAAELEGISVETLATYRKSPGIATADKMMGRDKDGRAWRRKGTPSAHPWYLRSTLKTSMKNPK